MTHNVRDSLELAEVQEVNLVLEIDVHEPIEQPAVNHKPVLLTLEVTRYERTHK